MPGTCLCNSPAGYLFPVRYWLAAYSPEGSATSYLRHLMYLTGWLMVGFFYRPHCYRLPYGA